LFVFVNRLVQEDRQSYAALRLSDTFNRPGVIEEGTTGDDLTRGMVTQPEMASDQWFTTEVRPTFTAWLHGYKKK